jgi:hypothetical protein
MAVIGFNFTKILIERKGPVKGKVNINNNVGITSVEETPLDINSAKKALKLEFQFTSTYEPNVGNIEMTGEVIYLLDQEKAEEAVKSWKKNKKLDKEMMTQALNNILAKCNIEALILSKDMNLPPPIPLPKIGAKDN